MAKYKKKPVVIEAFRMGIDYRPDWFQDEVTKGKIRTYSVKEGSRKTFCLIETLEGKMKGGYGDYIIKGVEGEIYPCKPDIFHKTYEEVEED